MTHVQWTLRRIFRAGFTLLELLIVLMILSVLAGLAVPTYQSSVERMRTSEAVEHLLATRGAMIRYYTTNSTYVGATIPLLSMGTLDFNPNVQMVGNNPIFTYDFAAGPTANTYTLRATRVFAGCGSPPSGTIRMDELGRITGTGIYG